MINKLNKTLLVATLAIGAVGFTGCSTTPEHRNMYTCIGFTEALNLASANIDKLSSEQVNVLHKVAQRVKPICGEGEVPSDDKVKSEVLRQARDTVEQILDRAGVK